MLTRQKRKQSPHQSQARAERPHKHLPSISMQLRNCSAKYLPADSQPTQTEARYASSVAGFFHATATNHPQHKPPLQSFTDQFASLLTASPSVKHRARSAHAGKNRLASLGLSHGSQATPVLIFRATPYISLSLYIFLPSFCHITRHFRV